MSVSSEILTENGVSNATPRDFFDLMKPRVMSLVIFTALVGMVAAPASTSPVLAFIALLSIAIGAGASGALNMAYDADIDAHMDRTRSRPVPAGRVNAGEALVFGIVLSGFSVVVLGLVSNWLAAGLLAFTIFFYGAIYTIWLKRATPQNIVIGGAAGAFPPVIGWAAMTGSTGLEAWLLFAIIFAWTPPHFWALALFKSADYARAGIPMMPNVAGNRSTQRQIFVYSLITAIAGIAPWAFGYAGLAFAVIALLLGLGLLRAGWSVYWMNPDDAAMKPAKLLFGYSIFYLFALFSALLVDAVLAGAV